MQSQLIDKLNDSFKTTNRVFVGILLIFGFIEMIVGGVTHSFLISGSTYGAGSWWVGFTIFILCLSSGIAIELNWFTSIKGCCNGYAILGSIVGLVCVIIGIAGSAYDGASYNILYQTVGCINPSSSKYFGDPKYSSDISFCESIVTTPITPSTCICIDLETLIEICTVYEISDYSAHDCNSLLGYTADSTNHYYPTMVHASVVICALSTVLVFFYSIILCAKGCGSQNATYIINNQSQGNQFELVNNPIQKSKSDDVNVSVA